MVTSQRADSRPAKRQYYESCRYRDACWGGFVAFAKIPTDLASVLAEGSVTGPNYAPGEGFAAGGFVTAPVCWQMKRWVMIIPIVDMEPARMNRPPCPRALQMRWSGRWSSLKCPNTARSSATPTAEAFI